MSNEYNRPQGLFSIMGLDMNLYAKNLKKNDENTETKK